MTWCKHVRHHLLPYLYLLYHRKPQRSEAPKAKRTVGTKQRIGNMGNQTHNYSPSNCNTNRLSDMELQKYATQRCTRAQRREDTQTHIGRKRAFMCSAPKHCTTPRSHCTLRARVPADDEEHQEPSPFIIVTSPRRTCAAREEWRY